jgi:hypothetical protein
MRTSQAVHSGKDICVSDLITINTIEQPGEFDVLTKLRPGEPYFVLAGRDTFAPPLVLEWAKNNRYRALEEGDAGKIDQDKLQDELRKSTQAEEIAWAMKAYKRGDRKPEAPASSRPTYTGHELPEQTKHTDAVHSARLRAGSAINAAVAELAALADAWRKLGGVGVDYARDIEEIEIPRLKELSADVTPTRPGIGK